MPGNWRNELRKDPRVIKYRKERWAKWRTLACDDKFVIETEKLRNALLAAHKQEPREVMRFFRLFSYPAMPKIAEIRRYLGRLNNQRLRQLLWRYVKYASQFGVGMTVRSKKRLFRLLALPPKGPRFHARLVKDQLMPVRSCPEHLYDSSLFESDRVETPVALRGQIERGEAKFIRIEDPFSTSVLSQIEDLTYDPASVTFVLHKAERPYLLLMIGEKVGKDVVSRAGGTITAFQREYFKRRRGGRNRDISKLRRARNLLRRPGSSKEKALTLMPHNTPEAAQSFLSKTKKDLQ